MAKKKATETSSVSPITAIAEKAIIACYTGGKVNKYGQVNELVRRHTTGTGRIASKVQNDALTRLVNKMRDNHNAFTGSQLTTLEFTKQFLVGNKDISTAFEFMRDETGRIVKASDSKRNAAWGSLNRQLKVFAYEVADLTIDKATQFTKKQVTNILVTAGKYFLATVQADARKMPRAVKVVKAEPAKAMAATA